MIRSILEWIGNTPWSVALLESYYVWPLIESTHVLTLAIFVGTAIINDIRLMGSGFGTVPASEVTTRILRWTRGSFAVMVVTGLLLFYSSPLRYYHNIFFRLKMLLLIAAGVNIWLFHSRIHRSVSEWSHDRIPPRSARIAGAVSLAVWAAIVVSGRMIAYNWFDCTIQPQPNWVNFLAACQITAP